MIRQVYQSVCLKTADYTSETALGSAASASQKAVLSFSYKCYLAAFLHQEQQKIDSQPCGPCFSYSLSRDSEKMGKLISCKLRNNGAQRHGQCTEVKAIARGKESVSKRARRWLTSLSPVWLPRIRLLHEASPPLAQVLADIASNSRDVSSRSGSCSQLLGRAWKI